MSEITNLRSQIDQVEKNGTRIKFLEMREDVEISTPVTEIKVGTSREGRSPHSPELSGKDRVGKRPRNRRNVQRVTYETNDPKGTNFFNPTFDETQTQSP